MGKRELWFCGSVNETSAKALLDGLIGLWRKKKARITLYITSPGGYIPVALAVYEFIRTKSIVLQTIAMGQVASSALLIFLAGKRRIATANTTFFVHEITRSWDSPPHLASRELTRLAEATVAEQKLMCRLLAEETGLSEEQWQTLAEQQTYITAQQALEYGLVHKVI